MEANNNNQSIVGDPEHVIGTGTNEPLEKKRKRQHNQDSQQHHNIEDIAGQLRNVQEKLAMLSAEYRTEIDAVKSENRLLSEKNNSLVANVSEMQDKQELLEQKLKVAEMEMKLAKKEMHKAAEANNHLQEELRKMASAQMGEEKVNKMIAKFEEKQRKFMEEIQHKFAEQEAKMAEKDKKLEQLENFAKQIDQRMADFGEKMATLESQTADDRNKLEKMRKTLEESNPTKLLWKNNKWHISDQKVLRTTTDGLTVTKTIRKDALITIRAQQHVSRAILALIPGQKLVYWEVQMKKKRAFGIGWVRPNVPLNDNKWIGDHPGSFAISFLGNYRESDRKVEGYGSGFGEGDVMGSGLLLTRDGEFKLFFTKNGALNGEPIVLDDDNQDLLLFPAVSFSFLWNDTSVEANFGADFAGKPFKFDVNAHEVQLFG